MSPSDVGNRVNAVFPASTLYPTEVSGTLWVIHAFQKKSRTGIRTPKREIDLVRARLGRLKRKYCDEPERQGMG